MNNLFKHKIISTGLLLCCLPSILAAFTLSGKVLIKNTPLPIANATVKLQSESTQTSTTSSAQGAFLLTAPSDNYTLIVSANNYIPYSTQITLTKNTILTLQCTLKTKITAPKQKVLANRSENSLSFHNVEAQTIARLSQATLFSDTMNSLKMLPGIASKSTFDAEIYIRGGNSYEIVGVLDNIPLYDPYLWGGRVSIFNSKIAQRVAFYPGGYHAQGGQSLSGIIDVYTKDGNVNKTQTDLDINLTELNFYHTSPIKKDKSTFMISYKQTYYDLFAPLFITSDYGNVQMPYLKTFQTKYTHKRSKNETIKAGFYFFNDGLDIPFDAIDDTTSEKGYFKYDLKQYLGILQYKKTFNKKMINDINLAFWNRAGDYDISIVNDNISDSYNLNHSNIILREDFSWDISTNHHIEIGSIFYKSNIDDSIDFTLTPNPEEENTVTLNLSSEWNEPALIGSFYIQDTWNITDKLSWKYGLRWENTKYSSYDWNSRLDPRIQLSYALTDFTKLKTYYGTYSQQLFENNTQATSGTLNTNDSLNFVAADTNMELATHYGAGVEHHLSPTKILKSEFFYKDYKQLGINSDTTGMLTTYSNAGKGYAKGTEITYQQHLTKKGEGWITYTYSKTKRKDNDGWYTPDFDLTHMVNIYIDYIFKPKTHIISTIKYSTGAPYTPILSSSVNPTTGASEYTLGDRLSERFNDYLRVDLWIEYETVKYILPIPFFPSKEKFLKLFPQWTFNGSTRIGFYNILATKNPVSYYWDEDKNEAVFVNDFPLMIIYGYNIVF